MPEAEFERTFADLAHARLRDRAPGLLDYMVGFQLLDKSEDDTHAVGVWGFKLGPEWMYAPVFFLNGQLKGDELLYIKSQDAFVPLKENWINYLLNRRPHILGAPEPKKQQELGITQPDFDAIARPPYTGSKYSKAEGLRSLVDYLTAKVASDFRAFVPVILSAPGGEKRAALDERWHLPTFIKRAGRKAAVTLINTMHKQAKFAEAVLKFYSMEELLKAAAAALHAKTAADGDKLITGTAPTVQVMLADRANINDLTVAMLSDTEKEKLQRDRYLVTDRRGDDQVSTVYTKQIKKTLQNPHGGGLCRVLFATGKYEPRLIVVNPMQDKSYQASDDTAMLINLDGNRVISAPMKSIFTDGEGHDQQAWQKKFDGLPAADSVRERQKVIFVDQKCNGTMGFFVKRKVSADGQTTLYGDFDYYPHRRHDRGLGSSEVTHPRFHGRVFNVSDSGYNNHGVECNSPSGSGDTSFVITGKPGRQITQIGDAYFVPSGFKALIVDENDIEPWKLKDYDRAKQPSETDPPSREPNPDELAGPQTLADIELQLFKSAEAVALTPITDGIEFFFRVNGDMSRPMSKLAALKELVERYGLRERDAQLMLKAARKNGAPEYIVKFAAGPSAGGQPYGAPPFPEPMMTSDPSIGGGVPVQYGQTDTVTVGSDTEPYRSNVMDMDATYRAQQAAQQGQKEVMDTAVIGGLVKTLDAESAVDNYIADLMLGLDRVGRILFMYYWHYEKFKDRYGAQDMPELEDNLKNVFDGLGDLTLFLKQKTVDPEISGASAEAELQQV